MIHHDGDPVYPKKYDNPLQEAYEWLCGPFGFDAEGIENNKRNLEVYLQRLMPDKIITFVHNISSMSKIGQMDAIFIDTETGTVLPNDTDLQTKKLIPIMKKRFKTYFDFDDIKSKFVYVQSISPEDNKNKNSTYIYIAHYNPNKRAVTFTIDDDVYRRFTNISDDMAINKSKFVENRMREFINKNS